MEILNIKGKYIITNLRTGEKWEYDNVIVQNFYNNIFNAMCNATHDLAVTHFATGTGLTQATRSDTALESEQFRKAITNIQYTATAIKVITILAPPDSIFQIKEVGIFTASGMISRCNVNIEKNSNDSYEVLYTITA